MAELSHRALRELIEDFGGCDEYFSEMLSAQAVLSGGRWESWYLDGGPDPARFVYQLTGTNCADIAAATAFLDTREAAGIDLNMGCSAPAITKTGAGAAWLCRPDEAARLVSAVRRKTSKRLSVKLRIGRTADFDQLVRFCKNLENEGADLIILHPRTSKEKFKRTVRWDYVVRLGAALRIPVVGNGDIDSVAVCMKRWNEGGVTALMLGRRAVKEPWIFTQIKGSAPPCINHEETMLRFLDLLERYQPPEFFVSRARRFFGYYCTNFTWGTWLVTQLCRETTHRKFAAVLAAYFAEHEDERSITVQ
ncbi:MAG: tRNA-dihydrouridine synthase family protein [Spirochaetaceae bacterium]|nr:tRNA-dihydrouridine synthase family protein [Spirochaetaceae bacterium]